MKKHIGTVKIGVVEQATPVIEDMHSDVLTWNVRDVLYKAHHLPQGHVSLNVVLNSAENSIQLSWVEENAKRKGFVFYC